MFKFRVIVFSILFFGGAFSLFSLVFNFGDWSQVVLMGSLGVFIGGAAAPSIEPKAFRHAWVYEFGFGCLAGAALGWALGTGAEAVGIGALLGGILGFLAPYWIKHIQIP